jgi:hypothetical protein
MSYVHALDLDALKLTFKQIIDIDTDLFAKQKTIDHELEKLKQTHNALIKENNKKIFIFCLDSFYFQYRILHQEMEDLSRFIIILNQRRIKMAHFNSLRSDTSNDLKRAPLKGAVLNLHWYK